MDEEEMLRWEAIYDNNNSIHLNEIRREVNHETTVKKLSRL